MTTLLEMAGYDRLPAKTSTKKQKGIKEKDSHSNEYSPKNLPSIFQSNFFISDLFLSFGLSIYTMDHRTIDVCVCVYPWQIAVFLLRAVYMYVCIGMFKVKAKRQRRSYLTDLINSVVEIIIILFKPVNVFLLPWGRLIERVCT